MKAGFDVPFYTRTGWPALRGKEVFGQLLPLYGDYADGFWDRKLEDMPGSYADAFIMRDKRMSSAIATETSSKEELSENSPSLSSKFIGVSKRRFKSPAIPFCRDIIVCMVVLFDKK